MKHMLAAATDQANQISIALKSIADVQGEKTRRLKLEEIELLVHALKTQLVRIEDFHNQSLGESRNANNQEDENLPLYSKRRLRH